MGLREGEIAIIDDATGKQKNKVGACRCGEKPVQAAASVGDARQHTAPVVGHLPVEGGTVVPHPDRGSIAVSDEQTEKLVAIVELKDREDTEGLTLVKSDVIAAISRAHGLQVADIVLVAPGSIPTTTSGKIRRAACVEQHRQGQFVRLDA